MTRILARIARLLPCLLAAAHGPAAGATEPIVAVAANLSRPMQVIAEDFADSEGRRVRLAFGSSGDLLRQIEAGAPFELYIAAASAYADRARAAHLTEGPPVMLAFARIGAFIPRGSPLDATRTVEALGRALAAGRYRRIAIANPEVAPFGEAARQALQKMGVWALEKDRVVLGENVAQTVQFTLAGGVDAGFIPESYALLPEVAARGTYLAVPIDWYAPLTQTMVLLRGAGMEARAFFAFLRSDAARAVLARSGFSVVPP